MALSSNTSAIKGLQSTLNGMKRSVAQTKNSVSNIQKIIINRTKVKSESVFKSKTLYQRRLDATRRKEAEDQLEISNISPALSPTVAIRSSGKGFVGRIISAIGYLAAGWLLNNLPTWIMMAREFVARVYRAVDITKEFFGAAVQFIGSFPLIIDAYAKNIISFDFFDTSGRVSTAFEQLNSSMETMQNSVNEALGLVTTPLTEQISEKEAGPGSVDTYTGEPFTGQEVSDGGKVNPQAIYSYLRSKGIDHIHAMGIVANIEGESGFRMGADETGDGSGGIGLFQYTYPSRKQAFLKSVPDWRKNWKGQVDYAIGQDPNTPLYLKRQFRSSEEAADNWMIQWENPSKAVYAERRRKHNAFIKSFKPSGSSQPGGQAQVKMTGGVSGSQLLLSAGQKGADPNVGATDRFGYSSWRGRHHNGIDIGTSLKKGYFVSFLKDGKITLLPNNGSAGNEAVIMSGGTKYRFLHLARFMTGAGEYKAGTVIGEIGKTGRSTSEHLHYEVWPSGTSGVNPEPFLNLISVGKNLQNAGRISSTASRNTAQSVTPTTVPEKINVIDARQPEAPPPPKSSGGVPQIMSSIQSAGSMLNNFIKQKFLTDLSYL